MAGRDVSWYALRVHLQAAATAVGASDQLQADVAIVTQSWPAGQSGGDLEVRGYAFRGSSYLIRMGRQ